MTYSCAAGGAPFSVTWAAWASDILRDWTIGMKDERSDELCDEPVSKVDS